MVAGVTFRQSAKSTKSDTVKPASSNLSQQASNDRPALKCSTVCALIRSLIVPGGTSVSDGMLCPYIKELEWLQKHCTRRTDGHAAIILMARVRACSRFCGVLKNTSLKPLPLRRWNKMLVTSFLSWFRMVYTPSTRFKSV